MRFEARNCRSGLSGAQPGLMSPTRPSACDPGPRMIDVRARNWLWITSRTASRCRYSQRRRHGFVGMDSTLSLAQLPLIVRLAVAVTAGLIAAMGYLQASAAADLALRAAAAPGKIIYNDAPTVKVSESAARRPSPQDRATGGGRARRHSRNARRSRSAFSHHAEIGRAQWRIPTSRSRSAAHASAAARWCRRRGRSMSSSCRGRWEMRRALHRLLL